MQTKQPMIVDVSGYEDRIQWKDATERPAMIIARAGYGYRVDTYFHEHMEQARALGIKRGMYHYFYAVPLKPRQTAAECVGDQAEAFVKLLREVGWTPDEPIFLDWETAGNEKAPVGYGLQRLIKQWLDHVERLTGVKPGIYSRKDQLDRMAAWGVMPAWIKDYDIWLAWYPNDPDKFSEIPKENTKIYPKYLDRIAMWQYSEEGRIGGMKPVHNYDMNMIYPWYAEKIGLTTPPAPRETYGVMWNYLPYASTDDERYFDKVIHAELTLEDGTKVILP